MALLTSPLFVAVSMVITLAVIACPTDSSPSILKCFGYPTCKTARTNNNGKIDNIAKTDDSAKIDNSVKIGNSEKTDNSGNIKHIPREERKWEWPEVPANDCDDAKPIKTVFNTAPVQIKEPHSEPASRLYFGSSQKDADHEYNYQTALENIRHMSHKLWDPKRYPTLDSYFKGEGNQALLFDGAKDLVLKVIGELPRIGSISSQTVRENKELGELLADRIFTFSWLPQFQNFLRDQFALFLDKSGLEERFKKVMKQHNIDLDNVDSPLANYLSTKKNAPKIIYALKMINELSSLDRTFSNELDFRADYVDLNPCFEDDPFANIVKSHLLKKIARKHSLRKIKELANVMKSDNSERPTKIGVIIDKIEKMAGDSSGRVRFDLLVECSALFSEVLPLMGLMIYDFATAKDDKEILEFRNYLGYCSLLRKRFKSRSLEGESWLGRSLQKLGEINYDAANPDGR